MSNKVNGIVYGKVSNVNDPDKMGRVKVSFQWLGSSVESGWLDVLSTFGGSFFVPEVDTQVVAAFYSGNTNAGVVLGGVWTTNQKPPKLDLGGSDFNEDGKNTKRYLRTRGGNRIAFDDMPGDQKIMFVNQQSINKIDFLAKTKEIKINSRNKVIVKASKKMKIKAKKGKITFDKDFNIECKNLNIEATKNINIEGSQFVEFKGQNVKLN